MDEIVGGMVVIAIYSRKSKFTGKGESIENQIELCKRYVQMHWEKEIENQVIIYEDEGFSGKTLDRPKFKEMMEDARKGKISSIIVYRLDRISRNIGDFAQLIEQLNDMHIAFVSIKEQFDTSSPMGRAMMYIASVFSQLERETIAERIQDNMKELAKTGRWLGGITPTGYQSKEVSRVTEQGKLKKTYQLEQIPEEIEIVKVIYHVFLETASLKETEQFLMEYGYKTKNKKLFSRFTIKGILSNPVYLNADQDAWDYLKQNGAMIFTERERFNGENGIMAYNRTLQRTGKTTKIREMKEWIIAVGAHKGIICGKKWIKVQKILERNRSRIRSNFPKETMLGLIVYEETNQRIGFDLNQDGTMLDTAVLEIIQEIPEDWDRVIDGLEKKIAYMKKEFELEENKENELEEKLEDIIQKIAHFPNILNYVTMQQKRELIHTIIEKVVWNGENAELYFRIM